MNAKLEIVAMVLGFLGLFGVVTSTAVPMWRVSAFIGSNLIVMEELWEGLWMNCFRQYQIRMQCKVYDSMLSLPPEMQAARGLMCVSIILVLVSLLVTGCGIRNSICCVDDMRSKNNTLVAGAALFLLSCLTTLVPVAWVTHTVIHKFYNPTVVDSEKRELGAALFVGWAAAGLLLVTGVILLVTYSSRKSKEEDPYGDTYIMAARSAPGESVDLTRRSSGTHKEHAYV
ncbi:claudin-4-like [Genypterus blacodes]|uniref:claudin-4-like n=1 Tax=Genypterus blacodes TaxID=154954 RepID=UPI003F765DBE